MYQVDNEFNCGDSCMYQVMNVDECWKFILDLFSSTLILQVNSLVFYIVKRKMVLTDFFHNIFYYRTKTSLLILMVEFFSIF